MRKWEFTGETMEFCGRTLRRIRATEDIQFPDGYRVEAGTIGGWIENENNLGDLAWVFGSARVFDSAVVCDSARVYGEAMVSSTSDLLTIGPIGSRADTTTFFRCVDGQIRVTCGCFYGTLDEFRAKVKATHGDNRHARDYLAAADFAEIKLAKEEDHDEG